MYKQAKIFLAFAMPTAMLAVMAGCGPSGPSLGAVKGKVTMYGKPLDNALVTFTPVGGGPAGFGPTDANGEFEVYSGGNRGAVYGKHKVAVTTRTKPQDNAPPPKEMRSDDPNYMAQALGSPADYKKKEFKEPIPARYNSSTELEFEVTGSSNTANFDLK